MEEISKRSFGDQNSRCQDSDLDYGIMVEERLFLTDKQRCEQECRGNKKESNSCDPFQDKDDEADILQQKKTLSFFLTVKKK